VFAPTLMRCFAALLLFGGSIGAVIAADNTRQGDRSQPVQTQSIQTKSIQTQQDMAHLTGAEIIRESLKRHELYPYVYEEQTLILTDTHKQHDVRRMRRYSRMEKNSDFKTKLEFIYPESIAGTALLFVRRADGSGSSRIFLPALGAKMTDYVGVISSGQMLGSEFSLQDFMPEDMPSFVYHRVDDMVMDNVVYFAIRADFSASSPASMRSYATRLLLVRQDNFFISRVDYFDNKAHLIKRRTQHDIHPVGGKMWRADMIKVENMLNHHGSILKIDRRVFSSDYAPESAFDESLLLLAAEQQAVADDAIRQPADTRKTGQGEKP